MRTKGKTLLNSNVILKLNNIGIHIESLLNNTLMLSNNELLLNFTLTCLIQ